MIIEVQQILSRHWNNIILAFFLAFLTSVQAQPLIQVHREAFLMGSRFDITVVETSQEKAEKAIELAIQEIQRIEKLISSWSDSSETSMINRKAGIKEVVASTELFELILRAQQISNLTQQAFDITYAAMDGLWQFDGSMKELPSPKAIQQRLALVGMDKILLEASRQSVYLPLKGMKIGFGAIGKGYAADRAKMLLQKQAVPGGIVNASGDLSVWGTNAQGDPWTIALTHPLDKAKVLGTFELNNQAVVTSGDYEKFQYLEEKKYSHIIDPRTGYPSQGLISSTVFAPKAELADALATALFVMGPDVGVDLIDQLPQVECILINEKGLIFTSKNIALEN